MVSEQQTVVSKKWGLTGLVLMGVSVVSIVALRLVVSGLNRDTFEGMQHANEVAAMGSAAIAILSLIGFLSSVLALLGVLAKRSVYGGAWMAIIGILINGLMTFAFGAFALVTFLYYT